MVFARVIKGARTLVARSREEAPGAVYGSLLEKLPHCRAHFVPSTCVTTLTLCDILRQLPIAPIVSARSKVMSGKRRDRVVNRRARARVLRTAERQRDKLSLNIVCRRECVAPAR